MLANALRFTMLPIQFQNILTCYSKIKTLAKWNEKIHFKSYVSKENISLYNVLKPKIKKFQIWEECPSRGGGKGNKGGMGWNLKNKSF